MRCYFAQQVFLKFVVYLQNLRIFRFDYILFECECNQNEDNCQKYRQKCFNGLSKISLIKRLEFFFTEIEVYFLNLLLNYKSLHKVIAFRCRALDMKRLIITCVQCRSKDFRSGGPNHNFTVLYYISLY